MRWKSNKPQHYGQARHKTKFLWLPKKLEGEWRWLEKATYLQQVDSIYSPHRKFLVWQDIKWIDKENKKKNI